MIRVFVDHCVNALLLDPLAERLPRDSEITTALSRGWEDLENGELLHRAEEYHDVFLSGDTNLPDQRELSTYDLTFVVIHAPSNRIEDQRSLVDNIAHCIRNHQGKTLFEISPEDGKPE